MTSGKRPYAVINRAGLYLTIPSTWEPFSHRTRRFNFFPYAETCAKLERGYVVGLVGV
jgi:hypothetical protein